MANNKIKPCPFCGGVCEVEEDHDMFMESKYVIACYNQKCDIQPTTDMYEHKKDCIKAWNKRSGDE